MVEVFKNLLADETRHLQILEDFYERYFLAENYRSIKIRYLV